MTSTIVAERDQSNVIFWTTLVIWLTVFATFSLPGRTQLGNGEVDSVAKIKVLVRAFSIAAMGWLAFSHMREKATRQIVASFIPWILFAGWAIVSTLWSPMRSITLGQAGGQVSLILLSVCIAFSANQGASKYLIHCLVALLVYSSIYGVGSLLFPSAIDVSRSSDNQIVHPSALGATASLGIVIATSLLVTNNAIRVRSLCLVAVPIFLLAMVSAHNRLSFGLMIVACFCLIVVKGKSHVIAAGGVVVAFVGVSYLFLDPGLTVLDSVLGSSVDFLNRGQTGAQLTELSGRSEMWSKMWNSFLDAPIFGHGYFVCSSSGTLFVWYTEQNHTAHNLFLQALVSSGIIGLAAFLIWNFQVLRLFLLSVSRSPFRKTLAVMAPALFFWFLGWSLLNSFVLGPIRPESAVYAVIVGLIVGGYHHPLSKMQQSREPDPSDELLSPASTGGLQ